MNEHEHRISKGLRILTTAAMLSSTIHGTTLAAIQTPGTCETVSLPVALAPGQPANQTIQGMLCNPLWWSGQHEVDVVVHGASYNSSYWSWPILTGEYSYAYDTLLVGRAVFAYDAVGAGASSHPPSTDITIDSAGHVLHQVLDWLRVKNSYTKFTVIGHSLGSITAVNESATYHDEDLLVLTGYSHAINPADEPIILGDFYPANLDPEFSGKGYDSGYLTSLPGVRGAIFYSSIANPVIIAYDEAHKDVISGTELGTAIAQVQVPPANSVDGKITVPVLEVLGVDDFIYCDSGSPVNCSSPASVRAFDAPYFKNVPSLSVETIPDTGHDLTLHPTDTLTFAEINAWIITH